MLYLRDDALLERPIDLGLALRLRILLRHVLLASFRHHGLHLLLVRSLVRAVILPSLRRLILPSRRLLGIPFCLPLLLLPPQPPL